MYNYLIIKGKVLKYYWNIYRGKLINIYVMLLRIIFIIYMLYTM